MCQENSYQYMHDENNKFQCVKIPYKQRDFSMLIVLPDAKDGVDAVVKCISQNRIEDLEKNNKFYSRTLRLQIPRFRVQVRMNLDSHLKALGIKNAFEQSANFSKMTVDDKMHVSQVFHKSFLEVTEGEAVAATRTDAKKHSSRSNQSKPIPFIVNRPFVFMIKYMNLTLFMGKVNALPGCESRS